MAKKRISDNIRLINSILIVLVVNVLMGCVSDIFSTKPKASFEYHPSKNIKTGDTIRFTNISKNADIYYWDFGDSCSSNEKEPTHVFKNKRIYTVKLYVSRRSVNDGNFEQENDSLIKQIDVSIGVPKASFSYKRTSNLTISFIDSSFRVTDYSWDFGDGTTSTEKEPIHEYSSFGTYDVRLTVTNDGVSDFVTKSITISDVISLNNVQAASIYVGGTSIDVDWDGVADFKFSTYSNLAPSGSNATSSISPLNNYEIITDTASTRVENLNTNPIFSTYLSTIPKIYTFGNTIQPPFSTTKSSLYFCTNQSMMVGKYSVCDAWISSETRYVGIRRIEGAISKIGWIKLGVPGFQTIVLCSYKIPIEGESLLIDK